MCMAISGGAIVPLLMGALEDKKFKAMSFVIPAACFVYLLLLSLMGGGKPAAAPATPES
jgi:FHS family L-fucose permease-like MFS transporter